MMELRSYSDLRPRLDDPLPKSSASILARRPDFRLGAAIVRPSLCLIEGPAGEAKLQRRMVEVLLALADGNGGVLTREDLIRLCWGGRIVGDDSIHRIIVALRRAARETGAEIEIETVARVGYRLVAEAKPLEPAGSLDADHAARTHPAPPVPRRAVLAAGAAVVGLATAAGWQVLKPRADPVTQQLLLRGEQALRDELPESDTQGIGFFTEALARDPDNARAWGLLALAQRNAVENAEPGRTQAAMRGAEQAIARALAIDPRQPDALTARATLMPPFGDWLAAERRLDAVLAVAPGHAAALGHYGVLMQMVGRDRASARAAQAAAAADPLSPAHQYRLAYKHSFAGHIAQADAVIDRAMQLWPQHPGVLLARVLIFLWTGRPAMARIAFDEEMGPKLQLPPYALALYHAWFDVIAQPTPELRAVVRQRTLAAAARAPHWAIVGLQVLSLIGEVDAAYMLAEGYLLRRGPAAGPLRTAAGERAFNEQRWRKTIMLFVPPAAAFRADPRFARLCEAIGLTAYWRERGVRPDFLGA
jgi:DNA-binding winged helix-turn-helix (wHTH) protein/Tfp pilus assembly protein PilF